MKIKDVLVSFNKFDKGKMIEQRDTDPEEIIVASHKDIDAPYYLNHNPTSFYCLNLPDIMNGNINLYSGGRHATGLEDYNGNRGRDLLFASEPSFSDGKLEFSTFDSLLLFILNKSSSICQSEGPFEFEFTKSHRTRTYVNIDGEFFKAYDLTSIIIKKGDSIGKNGQARMLMNVRNAIFD